MVVSAVYGTLTYLTNSILPAIFLHTGGNMLGAISLLGAGRSEWQAGPVTTPLIWETGPDDSFWLASGALVLLTTLSILAFRSLNSAVRNT
jgi:hypothetical protein